MTPIAGTARVLIIGEDSSVVRALNEKHSPSRSEPFQIESAIGPDRAVELARVALAQNKPYSVALVDTRALSCDAGATMIDRLWRIDPDLQIMVITTDVDAWWNEMEGRLDPTHRVVAVRSPVGGAEARQLARVLARKRLAESATRQCEVLQALNRRLEEEIVARAKAEDQLKHDALHDSLTSLPNRLLLTERLERCIERSKRNSDYMYAVMFLDLDDFKAINDTHGHAIGDQVLINVADRINASLRSLDTASRMDEQTPARMGGDEFVILLDGLKSFDDAMRVAERVHAAVCHRATVGGHEVPVGSSIGIALGSVEYEVPDDILRDADAALYHSKRSGKGRVGVFNEGARREMADRLRLSIDLHSAIHLEQLRLLFQPILSLESGTIESFEALVRWDHPQLGAVSPALFIPLAEETGAIHSIGAWVLRESCQQLRLWHDQIPDRRDLAVSVNVSPKQLAAPDFVGRVERTLAEMGLEGRHLIVEVTENALVENVEAVNTILFHLRDQGVRIHLDDFGVGYSSLSYLHQLPFDAIKIDRSFVKDMKLDAVHANTIMAIQTMASNRSMRVIAEGIETVEQLVQLQALDCAMGQGYYLARPIDAQTARSLLEQKLHAGQERSEAA